MKHCVEDVGAASLQGLDKEIDLWDEMNAIVEEWQEKGGVMREFLEQGHEEEEVYGHEETLKSRLSTGTRNSQEVWEQSFLFFNTIFSPMAMIFCSYKFKFI